MFSSFGCETALRPTGEAFTVMTGAEGVSLVLTQQTTAKKVNTPAEFSSFRQETALRPTGEVFTVMTEAEGLFKVKFLNRVVPRSGMYCLCISIMY